MTKQIILDKALALFMEKGYEGTSMNDIAVATGIRKASIYAHFKGKESIFLAIFEEILSEYVLFVEDVTAIQEGETALDCLERMFMGFIFYCHENPKMYFWDRYFYFPPAFIARYMQQKTQETQTLFLDGITQCLRIGMQKGDIRKQPETSAVLAYYYLMIGISMSVKLYHAETLERDAQAAWQGLREGLAPDSA